MADKKPVKKKAETPIIEKKEVKAPLKKYTLKRDYPTSKGVKKAGQTIELNEKARKLLTQQKYI